VERYSGTQFQKPATEKTRTQNMAEFGVLGTVTARIRNVDLVRLSDLTFRV